MADPVERMCEELGVCREEAICYLDGFEWNLDSAMEACRSKTLPLPFVTEETSSTLPEVIDSPRSLNQVPNTFEAQIEYLKNQRIQSFHEAAAGATLDEAVHYLERSDWDIDLAVGIFLDERRPTPSQRKSNMHDIPVPSISSSSQLKIGTSSSGSRKEHIPEAKLLKIQESSSPVQIREEGTLPPFKVNRICDATGVCREEALYYLEGFNWDLASAMEACRRKTLPPVKVKSSPGVSVNVKLASREWELPPSKPLAINEMQNQPEQLPIEMKNELIKTLCDVTGASPNEALTSLIHCNWSANEAICHFMDKLSGKFNSQRFSEYVTSNALALERQQKIFPYVPLMGLPSQSQLQPPLGSFSSLIDIDPTETEKPLKEASDESVTVATSPMVSSQVQNVQESRNPAQIREDTISPPKDTLVDQVYHETQVSREEAFSYSESNEILISTFCDTAGGLTRQEAISYLELCNWNVNQALGNFIDGFSEADISQALAMSSTENRGLPLSSMGLPSQSQIQASLGSSSSISADPTETERSLKEAGEENATVAIPGMASSQVEGKAVAEDSSTTFPDHSAIQDRTTVRPQAEPTTITITIVLPDDGSGMQLSLPFRSNQTIRDIRNAIDTLTPDNERAYYLQSMSGVDYKDPNITVYRIFEGGSTTLLLVFLNP